MLGYLKWQGTDASCSCNRRGWHSSIQNSPWALQRDWTAQPQLKSTLKRPCHGRLWACRISYDKGPSQGPLRLVRYSCWVERSKVGGSSLPPRLPRPQRSAPRSDQVTPRHRKKASDAWCRLLKTEKHERRQVKNTNLVWWQNPV